jgi:hypothetical protein
MAHEPAEWKRPVLFVFGVALLVGAAVLVWAQVRYAWARDWVVASLLALAGVFGVCVAVFGSDGLVARVMGDFDF